MKTLLWLLLIAVVVVAVVADYVKVVSTQKSHDIMKIVTKSDNPPVACECGAQAAATTTSD